MVISAGISQIGGKYRLRKELLDLTPHHDFFLSMFAGACWFELNKPRCRYECFNDIDSELINYLLTVSGRDEEGNYDTKIIEEFENLKNGVFGLVSQEICNRIKRGDLKPRNNIERAYFFYYLSSSLAVLKKKPLKSSSESVLFGLFNR